MLSDRNTVERAFELARTGEDTNLDDIARKLSREGYSCVASHLAGRSLRKQLKALIKASRIEERVD